MSRQLALENFTFRLIQPYMTTFAQAWKRQEQVRHQSLLQQLKSELSVKRVEPTLPSPQQVPSPASISNPLVPRPKPNKPRPETKELLRSIAIR